MKYAKQHFVTGMKVSLPDVLNRMEDGIAAACAAAVEGIGTVTTGDTPAAGIRDGKLCLTLPRGLPALDRDAALAALRAEWGLAEPDDTTLEAADADEGVL